LKFTVKNEKTKNYLKSFKPFQLVVVATSAGGYAKGFCEPFLALVDTGAMHTCISREIMDKINSTHEKASIHAEKLFLTT